MRYVLDTHALVWYLAQDPRLGREARKVLDDENNLLIVPVIVLAEAKYIASRRSLQPRILWRRHYSPHERPRHYPIGPASHALVKPLALKTVAQPSDVSGVTAPVCGSSEEQKGCYGLA